MKKTGIVRHGLFVAIITMIAGIQSHLIVKNWVPGASIGLFYSSIVAVMVERQNRKVS